MTGSFLGRIVGVSVFALLLVGVATAQPFPPKEFPGKGMPPKGFPGGGDNPNFRPFNPDEPDVPDVRPWLMGIKKKPKNIDPKLLKDLMQELQKKQKDNPQQFEQMLKDNPQFQDPEFLKKVGQMMQEDNFPKNFEQHLPKDNGNAPPPKVDPDFGNKLEEFLKKAHQNENPNFDPKNFDPKIDPKNFDPKIDPKNFDPKIDPKVDPFDPKNFPNLPDVKTPETPKNDLPKHEWVNWAEKNFGDSPEMQAAVKDLMGSLDKKDVKGLFDKVGDKNDWKDFNEWGKKNVGDDWKLKPPDTGKNTNITPPKINNNSGGGNNGPKITSPNINAPSAPNFGGGGGLSGGAEGLGLFLGIVVGIGIAIFALIFLLRWLNRPEEQETILRVPVGSGLDYSNIHTREELVVAFDNLSLDKCGEEAMNWNHRVIADELIDKQPHNEEPANELADLYERARYAPENEDLTPNDFASARNDLSTIAGVSR